MGKKKHIFNRSDIYNKNIDNSNVYFTIVALSYKQEITSWFFNWRLVTVIFFFGI